jgi:hypothetical protein
MKCIVFLLCSVVVAIYMATIRVYLHDVSLMLVRVEGAHRGEGGAPGQHTWHTQCPFLINRNKFSDWQRDVMREYSFSHVLTFWFFRFC